MRLAAGPALTQLFVCVIYTLNSGCFAYYGFKQAPNPPTPVELMLSPSQLTLFSGEQFSLTASIGSPQKFSLDVSVDTAAFTCDPVTVAPGARSVELHCTAGTSSVSADIHISGTGLEGRTSFSLEVLAGERFTLPTRAFTLKRGAQTTLTLSVTPTPGFNNSATIELESAEPTMTVTPGSIQTDSPGATLTFSVAGDSGTETPTAATLRITSAGKVTTLPINPTMVPRAGTIDTGFGTAGHALADFNTNGNTYNLVKTIAVDSMGRVVVAGLTGARVPTTLTGRVGIARLTPGGALDTTYATGGIGLFAGPNPANFYNLADAALDPRDEMWLCGTDDTSAAIVVRVSSSGNALGSASRNSSSGCLAITVAGTERAYSHVDETGHTAIGSISESTLANTDKFSAYLTTGFGLEEGASAIAATGGTYVLAGGSAGSAWIVRISNPASNVPDAAFGASGLAFYSSPATLPYYRTMLISGSEIFAAGASSPSGGQEALLTKSSLQSGQRDPQFGTGGITTLPGERNVLSIARQSDGKLLLAGQTVSAGPSEAFVARILPNGQPDENFAPGGVLTLPTIEAGNAMAGAVAVAPNGHIYVAVSYACSERFLCSTEGPNARSAVFAIWP